MRNLIKFAKRFFNKCRRCRKYGAEERRQLTAYIDDRKNFAVLCDECQKEEDEYWQERWNDYYRGLL